MELDSKYWNKRYIENNTPWDVGDTVPAILKLVRQHCKTTDKILFPGAGLAHDAVTLRAEGYKHIYVCDWAEAAIQRIVDQHQYPQELLICSNFFEIATKYDRILEMTFFCALDPSLRPQYVLKCHELLTKNGKILGLLFNKSFPNNPPFGGSAEEYTDLFSKTFNIQHLQTSKNSIEARQGSELEFIFKKK